MNDIDKKVGKYLERAMLIARKSILVIDKHSEFKQGQWEAHNEIVNGQIIEIAKMIQKEELERRDIVEQVEVPKINLPDLKY